MNFIVSGKNITVTEALKNYATSKVGKIEKFFNKDSEVHITMSVQKNRQIVEVTVKFNGLVLRGEEASEDMYASIDKVVDVLEKQIIKNKTRLTKKLHEAAFKTSGLSESHEEKEEDYKILKEKKFDVKPMNIEEAILQMNLLGHEFFMFRNSDSEKINLVYKRKDGNYGLIEPEE